MKAHEFRPFQTPSFQRQLERIYTPSTPTEKRVEERVEEHDQQIRELQWALEELQRNLKEMRATLELMVNQLETVQRQFSKSVSR